MTKGNGLLGAPGGSQAPLEGASGGREDPLWNRLTAWSPDDPASEFPFTARLARDNRWSSAFAQRVVEEYRRFTYLFVRAGHPVTPSDHVDQAWHLHLLYTRDYWATFCKDVLQQPMHHGPTRGGADERTKFTDWYGKTLASYEAHFGCTPPRDVWPPTGIRMTEPLGYARVDVSRHWVVPKRGVRKLVVAIVGALAGVGLLTACAPLLPVASSGAVLIIVFVAVLAAVGIISSRRRERELEALHVKLLERLSRETDPKRRAALEAQLEALRKRRKRRTGGGACGGCSDVPGMGCGGDGGCGGCGGCS